MQAELSVVGYSYVARNRSLYLRNFSDLKQQRFILKLHAYCDSGRDSARVLTLNPRWRKSYHLYFYRSLWQKEDQVLAGLEWAVNCSVLEVTECYNWLARTINVALSNHKRDRNCIPTSDSKVTTLLSELTFFYFKTNPVY